MISVCVRAFGAPCSEAMAAALLLEAERHNDQEETQLAEAKASEALEALRGTPEACPGPAEAVRLLALGCCARGDRRGGLALLAAERPRLLGRRPQGVLALAFAELANSRCGSKRREEALERALEAVEVFRELGDRRFQGLALLAQAHTHVQRGTKSEIPEELERALEVAEEAHELLRTVGDRVGEGKALHTIAVTLSFQNNVDEAVARARAARPLQRRREPLWHLFLREEMPLKHRVLPQICQYPMDSSSFRSS